MILNSVILELWNSLAPKSPSAARIFSTAIKASGARGFQGRSPCLVFDVEKVISILKHYFSEAEAIPQI
jgi:hypothetical protein